MDRYADSERPRRPAREVTAVTESPRRPRGARAAPKAAARAGGDPAAERGSVDPAVDVDAAAASEVDAAAAAPDDVADDESPDLAELYDALAPPDADAVLASIFGRATEPDDGVFRSGFVAVVGRPNVGKSTITNAFVGDKVAIVSPKPQTTRRRILGIRTTDAAQAIFVDTPGIHRPRTPLGSYMVKVARDAIPDADVVVWVVDASAPPRALDERVAAMVRRAGRPTVLALNKSDRLAPEDIAARVDAFRALAGEGAVWELTIATRGHNLDRLWALIVERLPAGPLYYPPDQISDQTDRMLVAELVREAALFTLEDEVPHGIEVVVETWALRDNGVTVIGARLLVEREGHKPIVIGKGGAVLKAIGTRARRDIEALLEGPVYLELQVGVRPGWRRSAAETKRLGYG